MSVACPCWQKNSSICVSVQLTKHCLCLWTLPAHKALFVSVDASCTQSTVCVCGRLLHTKHCLCLWTPSAHKALFVSVDAFCTQSTVCVCGRFLHTKYCLCLGMPPAHKVLFVSGDTSCTQSIVCVWVWLLHTKHCLCLGMTHTYKALFVSGYDSYIQSTVCVCGRLPHTKHCLCLGTTPAHKALFVSGNESCTQSTVCVWERLLHTKRCLCLGTTPVHKALFVSGDASSTQSTVCVWVWLLYTKYWLCLWTPPAHKALFVSGDASCTQSTVCVWGCLLLPLQGVFHEHIRLENIACREHSCRSNLISHLVYVNWHWANQSQHWPEYHVSGRVATRMPMFEVTDRTKPGFEPQPLPHLKHCRCRTTYHQGGLAYKYKVHWNITIAQVRLPSGSFSQTQGPLEHYHWTRTSPTWAILTNTRSTGTLPLNKYISHLGHSHKHKVHWNITTEQAHLPSGSFSEATCCTVDLHVTCVIKSVRHFSFNCHPWKHFGETLTQAEETNTDKKKVNLLNVIKYLYLCC